MKSLTAIKFAFVSILGFAVLAGCNNNPPADTATPTSSTTIIHDHTPPASTPNVTINPPADTSTHTETHTNTTNTVPVPATTAGDTGAPATTGTSTTTTGN
jgi:hypothetical protein